MNILYYTSGVTGSGRVVRGISIGNALKRNGIDCSYKILSSSSFAFLVDEFNHIEIPPEKIDSFSNNNYGSSILHRTLIDLKPDILLVDLLWFPLSNFINKLFCKKIFLFRQTDDSFFSIPAADGQLNFRAGDYDQVLAIEPFKSSIKTKSIHPIIIKNKNEIFSRKEAANKLDLDERHKACLLAYNGHPGDFKRVKKTYSYLEDQGYQMVYTTNYEKGIFPVVDYFNVFDLIVCGAGYNSFWDTIYFKKEAISIPTPTKVENQERRIKECQGYSFNENGADQLVNIIMNL